MCRNHFPANNVCTARDMCAVWNKKYAMEVKKPVDHFKVLVRKRMRLYAAD